MTSSMSLTDKESFDNYLDYKDDIEYELSLKMVYRDVEHLDLAVLKELHTKDLVNHAFYKKQRESIKVIHEYRRNHRQASIQERLLCILFCIMWPTLLYLIVQYPVTWIGETFADKYDL